MLSAEQNDLITRTGPGTPAGRLMRCYWQPAALVDELAGNRPIKPVRLLGESLVAFRDGQGRYGLIERACPHRGTDLAFGRLEHAGLRCSFHGWLFDVTGQCLDTPAEPDHPHFLVWIASTHPQPTPSPSRASSTATGCNRSRSVSTLPTLRFFTA